MKYRHKLLTAMAVHETAIAKFTDEEFLSGIFRDKLRRNLSVTACRLSFPRALKLCGDASGGATERDQRKFIDANYYAILNLCISGNFVLHHSIKK